MLTILSDGLTGHHLPPLLLLLARPSILANRIRDKRIKMIRLLETHSYDILGDAIGSLDQLHNPVCSRVG